MAALAALTAVAGLTTPALAQFPAEPPVTAAKPVQRTVTEWAEYTGRFVAVDRVEIRSRVEGYLKAIEFSDGDLVKKGQVLFIIDPAPFEAAVARARSSVAAAKSRLELDQLRLSRAKQLLESRAISREENDTRLANVEISRAEVSSAEANLRTAELDLSYSRITAPMDGRMSYSRVDVGNVISAAASSATMLTTIISTDPVKFVFDIDERDFLSYAQNRGAQSRPSPEHPIEPVFVKLNDEKDWTRQGRVEFTDNEFDSASSTLRMYALFPNTDGKLVPGLFGRLRLPTTAPHEALLIDPKAVLADQSVKIVMVVGADGVVAPRPVELGPLDHGLQIVRSGLKADERIIVSGLLRARPGSKVTPNEVPMGAPPAPPGGPGKPGAQ